MASVILLFIIDLIFAFTEIGVWLSNDPKNPIWATLRSMHNFGVFCFSVILALKVKIF